MILSVTLNPAIDKIYFQDSFEIGKVHRPIKMINSPGGKGLNVARVVHNLGAQVTATGFLGGSNGAYISELLLDEGIIDRFTKISGQTRICINITDTTSLSCTEMLEPGPLITETEVEQFLTNYQELIKKASVITMSGSLPIGVPIDFYATLIERAKEYQIPVLLDTSGNSLLSSVISKPFLIKPNTDELNVIYPLDELGIDNYIEAIRSMKEMGVTIPIITLGKNGAIAGLSDGIYKVDIPNLKIVNTVGSGDSFIAGCAVAIERGYIETDMLKLGSACGCANTQFQRSGYVECEYVEKYFEHIKINKVGEYI